MEQITPAELDHIEALARAASEVEPDTEKAVKTYCDDSGAEEMSFVNIGDEGYAMFNPRPDALLFHAASATILRLCAALRQMEEERDEYEGIIDGLNAYLDLHGIPRTENGEDALDLEERIEMVFKSHDADREHREIERERLELQQPITPPAPGLPSVEAFQAHQEAWPVQVTKSDNAGLWTVKHEAASIAVFLPVAVIAGERYCLSFDSNQLEVLHESDFQESTWLPCRPEVPVALAVTEMEASHE